MVTTAILGGLVGFILGYALGHREGTAQERAKRVTSIRAALRKPAARMVKRKGPPRAS